MNSKVLIIFIILVLILLMICLITKKPNIENFFAAGDGCGVKETEEDCGDLDGCNWANGACEDYCLFDPVDDDLDICTDATNSECISETHTKLCYWDADFNNGAGQCLYRRTGEDNSKYSNERADATKAHADCLTDCTTNWDHADGQEMSARGFTTSDISRCSTDICNSKCNAYAVARATATLEAQMQYKDYLADHVNNGDYTKIKADIITALQTSDSDLKTAFKDNLYGDVVCTDKDINPCKNSGECEWDAANTVCKSANISKLNDIMKTLAKLNNLGNDFVQQIGQLGEFQEKYSDKIEEILEGRAEKEPTEGYIRALNSKLEEVNKIFNNIDENTFGKTNMQALLESPHKSITCIANNITLNLTPVQYTNDTEKYYPKRYGAYMINLDDSNFLHYYSWSSSDKDREVCAIDSDPECDKWKLADTTAYKEKFTEAMNKKNAGDALHIISKAEGAVWDALQKRDGFFWILKINSEQDYNSILIKNNIDSIIESSDKPIKYPFYVVESARRSGYLLNVKTSGTRRELTVERANNNGTEKFTASPAPTAKCISYQ